MKANLAVAIAAFGLTLFWGCVDIEIRIPVITNVATIDGNAALHKAHTKLHGNLLEPAHIEPDLGLKNEKLKSVHLLKFNLRVTPEAWDGPGDNDDLAFIEEVIIFAHSNAPDKTLEDLPVAWYYAQEDDGTDFSEISFEVDKKLNLLPYVESGFELTTTSVTFVPEDDVSVEGEALFSAIPTQ